MTKALTDADRVAREKARWPMSVAIEHFGLRRERRAPERPFCPICHEGIVELRADDRGGRCASCDRGFDVINFLQFGKKWSFNETLHALTKGNPDAEPDEKTGDLF